MAWVMSVTNSLWMPSRIVSPCGVSRSSSLLLEARQLSLQASRSKHSSRYISTYDTSTSAFVPMASNSLLRSKISCKAYGITPSAKSIPLRVNVFPLLVCPSVKRTYHGNDTSNGERLRSYDNITQILLTSEESSVEAFEYVLDQRSTRQLIYSASAGLFIEGPVILEPVLLRPRYHVFATHSGHGTEAATTACLDFCSIKGSYSNTHLDVAVHWRSGCCSVCEILYRAVK